MIVRMVLEIPVASKLGTPGEFHHQVSCNYSGRSRNVQRWVQVQEVLNNCDSILFSWVELIAQKPV